MQVALESLPGITGAAVDVGKKTALVSCDAEHASTDEMIAAIVKVGFNASL